MGSRMLGNMNTRRQDISTHCHTVFVVSATASPITVLGAVAAGADGTLGILGTLAHEVKRRRIKYLIFYLLWFVILGVSYPFFESVHSILGQS